MKVVSRVTLPLLQVHKETWKSQECLVMIAKTLFQVLWLLASDSHSQKLFTVTRRRRVCLR